MPRCDGLRRRMRERGRQEGVDWLKRDLSCHPQPEIEIDREIQGLVEGPGELPGSASEEARGLHEVPARQPVAEPLERKILRSASATRLTARGVDEATVAREGSGLRKSSCVSGDDLDAPWIQAILGVNYAEHIAHSTHENSS